MILTPHQEAAKAAVLEGLASDRTPEVSLAGPAGTGKTTMAKSLIADLIDQVNDVAVVAPTNKAAKVLNDKGITATTIHSKFFIADKQSGSKVRFWSAREWTSKGLPLPEGKTDYAEIIAIDEASMLNTWVLGELRKMSDKIIMIGDQHQLPPVNDKLYPAGYFNTIRHTAQLSEVLRQSEGNPILKLASRLRNDVFSDDMTALTRPFYPDRAFADVAVDLPQFIAFTNKVRTRVNRLVRSRIGISSPLPEVGEKVICANNHDDLLLNGTEATVVDFDWNGVSRRASIRLEVGRGDISVVRDAPLCMYTFLNDLQPSHREKYASLMNEWKRQLDSASTRERAAADEDLALRYGYCITAHAAQGSEFDSVVVIDQYSTLLWAGSNNAEVMPPLEFARRWMYTAITRAKKELIIAPEWWTSQAPVGRVAA